MTTDDMKYVVARMLTDPGFQQEFFAASAVHKAFGLDEVEFDLLRTLDPDHFGICSEGYTGKRFDEIQSEFPLTLRFLDGYGTGFRSKYLAETKMPGGRSAELATFKEYMRTWTEPRTDLNRLIQDLFEIERAHSQCMRDHSSGTLNAPLDGPAPVIVDGATVCQTRGPIWQIDLYNPQNGSIKYPCMTGSVLVRRRGASLHITRLTRDENEVLRLCNGKNTVRDISTLLQVEAAVQIAALEDRGFVQIQV